MNLFRFFNHSEVRGFARELALKLSKEISPALMESRRKVLSVNKITRLLERTYHAACDYQLEHHIGFLKRAILLNTFKWELKNLGYPDDFIDVATEGLVVKLSTASRMSSTGR